MTPTQLIHQTRITRVWQWLGGPEIRRGRSRAWWRNGDGLSVALDDKRNVWFDHRDSIGGGVLDLIQHIRGGTRAEALRSLAGWQGLPLDGVQLSPEERRRYAVARQHAPNLAHQAEVWWIERRAELEREKTDALERMEAARKHGEDPTPAVAALQAAASEHHLLTLMRGTGIVRAYLMARRDDPAHTAALVAEGERWREIAESLVTLLIERWAKEAAG